MKIYYQWEIWAYSNIVWNHFSNNLWNLEVIWVKNFLQVFEKISENNLWIVPIENSYAGSVYENFNNLKKFDYYIYAEYFLEINHVLASKSKNIEEIKKVYSHYQALMQCDNFIKKHNFEPINYFDTATSAKFVSETNDEEIASISSKLAADIYWLNILQEKIQDQQWNTTRFFLVWKKYLDLNIKKSWKISLIFKTKNIPSALYKCLWAFATRNINLTKIESIPAMQNPFESVFYVDFEGFLIDENIVWALKELEFFTQELKILWDY